MNQLAAICDSPENARRVHWQLKGLFDIQCLSPDELGAAQPPGRYTIVAVNLDDLERVRGIRQCACRRRNGFCAAAGRCLGAFDQALRRLPVRARQAEILRRSITRDRGCARIRASGVCFGMAWGAVRPDCDERRTSPTRWRSKAWRHGSKRCAGIAVTPTGTRCW